MDGGIVLGSIVRIDGALVVGSKEGDTDGVAVGPNDGVFEGKGFVGMAVTGVFEGSMLGDDEGMDDKAEGASLQ